MISELPVGWQVWVQPVNARPFNREFRPKPRRTQVFPTRAEAEAEKQRQQQWFGEHAIVHIQPVFVSRTARDRKFNAAQTSLTDSGWPIQMRPPRLGMRRKGRQ